jgi:hypothetical protein
MAENEREGAESLDRAIQNMNTSAGDVVLAGDPQTTFEDALVSNSSTYAFAREFNEELEASE